MEPYRPLNRLGKDLAAKEELRFVVLGDTQPRADPETGELTWHPMSATIRDLALSLSPDLVIHTGDVVDVADAYSEGFREDLGEMWRQFRAGYGPLLDRVAMLPAKGNHDDEPTGSYEAFFELPGAERYYEITIAGVGFVALDSNRPQEWDPGGEQYEWLREVLEAQAGIRHTFVFFHHPPFTVGPWDPTDVRKIHEILQEHHSSIRAVFSGHDHLYYRTRVDGIFYFVTGGGGWYLSDVRPEKAAQTREGDRFESLHECLLVRVGPEEIRVECRASDGSIFDEVVIWTRGE